MTPQTYVYLVHQITGILLFTPVVTLRSFPWWQKTEISMRSQTNFRLNCYKLLAYRVLWNDFSLSGFMFLLVWIIYSVTSKVNKFSSFNRRATNWRLSGAFIWCHQSWMTRSVCVLLHFHLSRFCRDIPFGLICQKSSSYNLKFNTSESKLTWKQIIFGEKKLL